jgi:hypothetical protein
VKVGDSLLLLLILSTEFSSNRKHRAAESTRRVTSLLTSQRLLAFKLKPIFAMDNLNRLYREDYNKSKASEMPGNAELP